jgi:hypothetical protein
MLMRNLCFAAFYLNAATWIWAAHRIYQLRDRAHTIIAVCMLLFGLGLGVVITLTMVEA